jgi:hypothetical protein
MSLSDSMKKAARKLVDTFGNDATHYPYLNATVSNNDEGDATIVNWGPSTVLCDCSTTTGWDTSDTPDLTLTTNTTTFKVTPALNFTKTGINDVYLLGKKTISSVNLTGKSICYYMYIKDNATLAKIQGIEMIVGDDDANYYDWTTMVANLVVGWNTIVLPLSSATVVGTPGTASTMLWVLISSNASSDTWSAGEVVIDEIMVLSSPTVIKVVDGQNVKEVFSQATQGIESLGEDEKIVRDTVTIVLNDRLDIDNIAYKVVSIRPLKTQSVAIVYIIKVIRVTDTTSW